MMKTTMNKIHYQIMEIIATSGNIEKYLTAENVRKFGLNSSQVMQLIKESGNIKKYLTPESIKEYNFRRDYES